MARFCFCLLGLCGFSCGGRIDDSTLADTTINYATGGTSSTSGGTTRPGPLNTGGTTAGGQSSLPLQTGGTSQGGSGTRGTRLRRISQTDADQLSALACNTYTLTSATRDLQLDWVVDASNSANDSDSGSSRTHWALARAFVTQTQSQLAARGKCVAGCTGLLAFPLREAPIAPGTIDNCIDVSQRFGPVCFGDWGGVDLSSINQRLSNIVPSGGTPLLDAYRYVVQQHVALGSAPSSYILLVTDGMPSIDAGCSLPDADAGAAPTFWSTPRVDDRAVAPTVPIIDEIASAHSLGITTIVVGSSSDPSTRSWLSRAAEAGGSSWIRCGSSATEPYCHLDLTAGLDVSNLIAEALLPNLADDPCRFHIPVNGLAGNTPIDWHDFVPVIRSPNPDRVWAVDFDDGPAQDCSDGFRVVSPGVFELCPQSCNLLSTECMATIEVNQLCAGQNQH